MITKRDREVINFIKKFKVATTSTIAELFYPSLRVAQRRLMTLVSHRELKRERYYINQEYMYYIKKPKQLRHRLLLTDFYREIHKLGFEIEYFDNEVIIDDIRPDGLLAYRYQNKAYIAFVEVEISNKGLNISKYKKLLKTGKYKKYFPVFPIIIAITDHKIPIQQDLVIIQVKEDLSNIKTCFRQL
ncbi:hypothetical protein [Caloranaerobacter sp. DY30410]|uniref:hypothetical protein n=1 Tax=Caloranaerobacter sp. DY30410 TaxID=3238305 RepID=UPI003CFD2DF1